MKLLLALFVLLATSSSYATTINSNHTLTTCPTTASVGSLVNSDGSVYYFYLSTSATQYGTQEWIVSRYKNSGGVLAETCYDVSPVSFGGYYMGWAINSSWFQSAGMFGFTTFDQDLYSTTNGGLTWTVSSCVAACPAIPTTATFCYHKSSRAPLICSAGQFCSYLGNEQGNTVGSCNAPCLHISHPATQVCGCAIELVAVNGVCPQGYSKIDGQNVCFISSANINYCQ